MKTAHAHRIACRRVASVRRVRDRGRELELECRLEHAWLAHFAAAHPAQPTGASANMFNPLTLKAQLSEDVAAVASKWR